MDDGERITYFGETDSRNKRVKFGIKAKDRTKHIYVIGKTGMGKSVLLENFAAQDIQNGEGFAFIDPHGSTAETLLDYVPEHRVKDVIYLAPFDIDYPVAFNVMEDVGYDKRHLVVSGLMSAFKKIWEDQWSARMEYILSNTLMALLEYPDSTLLDVNRMLIEKPFRKKVVEYITDPIVRSFWVDEFANYTDRYTQDATPAIQNKVGQFTSNPLIRNIVGQPKSSFDFRELMDQRKILIINLSKGRIGETNADLLGSMITTKIYLSAMSRAELPPPQLAKTPIFYFYVDEFQSVANDSFADILSEARKYNLSLTITHQYVEQMEENVRDAVFGNVGTTIMFRVGPFDAETLEPLFKPLFFQDDLVNLDKYQVYLSLMIDGVGSQPFSARTLPPLELPQLSYRDQVIANTRKTYAAERAIVEADIAKRMEAAPQQEASKKEGGGDRPPPRRGDSSRSQNRPSTPRRSEQERPVQSRHGRDQNRPAHTSGGQQVSQTQQSHSRQPIDTREKLREMAMKESQKKEKAQEVRSAKRQQGAQDQRADLRNALAGMLKENEKGAKDNRESEEKKSSPKPPSPRQQKPVQKNRSQDARSAERGSRGEVPEKVLREMLDVDKK